MKALSWSARLSAERRRAPKLLAHHLQGVLTALAVVSRGAQTPASPDWKALEGEIMEVLMKGNRLRVCGATLSGSQGG
jgi:hypothetical protein